MSDEQRKKFEEALAHKDAHNSDPHRNSPHGSGKANEAHRAEGTRSMFRRKSGG
ncbi:DUF5302 family protein [Hoyosella rhizosphaerae]|nr:DUF5302 family protein [Hoyosella rhizosphaerae]